MSHCCLHSSGAISSTFYKPPENETVRVGTSRALNAWKISIQKTSAKQLKWWYAIIFKNFKILYFHLGRGENLDQWLALYVRGHFKTFLKFILKK